MNNQNDEYREDKRKAKKFLWKLLLIIVLILVGSWVLSIVLIPAKTTKDVIEKTMDADNVIFNYEMFYNEYNDWKQIQDKIKTHEARLADFYDVYGKDAKEWGYSAKQERSNITAIIAGLNDQRNDIESRYNSNSDKINRNLFKSNNLPYKLENGQELWD